MPDFLKENLKQDYCLVIKCKALFKCFVANKRHSLVSICAEKNVLYTLQTLCDDFLGQYINHQMEIKTNTMSDSKFTGGGVTTSIHTKACI